MNWFVDEREHRARRVRRCDYCFDWILPGQLYRKRIWVPKRGVLHELCEHIEPSCPQEALDEVYPRVEERITMRLAVEERIAVLRNGDHVIEPHLVCVPVTEGETASNDEEDIPF